MQKFIFISMICLVLLLTFGCTPKNANNANNAANTNTSANSGPLDVTATKTLLTDYLAVTNALDKAVQPNADPKVVGQALVEYTTKMKEYSPKLKDLTGNHNDFIINPPEDMKQLVADYQATAQTLERIFTHLAPYMQDPVVKEAISNL